MGRVAAGGGSARLDRRGGRVGRTERGAAACLCIGRQPSCRWFGAPHFARGSRRHDKGAVGLGRAGDRPGAAPVPSRCVAGADSVMNLVEDYLANGDLSDAPVLLREFRPAGSVLVTPRYPDSRHVVILLLDESGDPRVVGKVVRRPDDRSTLALEADVLQNLGSGAEQ